MNTKMSPRSRAAPLFIAAPFPMVYGCETRSPDVRGTHRHGSIGRAVVDDNYFPPGKQLPQFRQQLLNAADSSFGWEE